MTIVREPSPTKETLATLSAAAPENQNASFRTQNSPPPPPLSERARHIKTLNTGLRGQTAYRADHGDDKEQKPWGATGRSELDGTGRRNRTS